MSKKKLGYGLGTLLLAVPFAGFAASGSGIDLMDANISHHDRESIRKGAEHFAEYCMGCHSVKHLRYQRVAEDTGKGENWAKQNLIHDEDTKYHEQMISSMDPADGEKWFATAPPDLSTTARIHGADWIYTYLNTYYQDESATVGFNNLVQPGTSMPHVLAHLQGTPKPVHDDDGKVTEIKPAQGGELSESEYEQMTAELTAFLAYAAEPIKADRERMGIWVILFLMVMTTVFYLVYKEFWRDLKQK